MANKNKYSGLSEEELLKLIRNGDEEAYKSEKDRTVAAIKEKQKLGLDISDEIKAADRIGYNNALSKAADEASVSKTGYGVDWLYEIYKSGINDTKTLDGIRSTLETELSLKNLGIDSEKDDAISGITAETKVKKRQAYNEAMNKVPVMRERFANLGLSSEGGTVRTAELEFNNALDSALLELDKLLASNKNNLEISASKEKLANLSSMLEKLRSESQRIEAEEYQKKQDEIANKLAKQKLALEAKSIENAKKANDARIELEKKELALKESQYANEAKLAATKLLLGSLDDKNTKNEYMEIIKKYAPEYLGITNSPSVGKISADNLISPVKLTRDEIKNAMFVIQHMNMSEAVKRDFYEKSGLYAYMTYEQAIGKAAYIV